MIKRAPFRIGDTSVAPGTRTTVDIPVSTLSDHTPVNLSVHVIHGSRPGPVLFVSAAIHGDEVIGVEIVRRLLRARGIRSLRGTLLAVPIVNTYGFLNHARYLPDRRGAAGLTLFYALLFFLAAGEEISWGQRIIGWESGEFFQENNQQVETNVHNLVVFGSQLTKTLFGPVLTAIILVYLVVLPLLYVRTDWVQRLSDRFVVPVPWLKHGIIALSASILIALIDVDRKWEVYELVFSLIVVSIFLLPQNRDKVS